MHVIKEQVVGAEAVSPWNAYTTAGDIGDRTPGASGLAVDQSNRRAVLCVTAEATP